MKYRLWIVGVAMAVSACTVSTGPAAAPDAPAQVDLAPPLEADALAVTAKYEAALATNDAAALAALYAPESTSFMADRNALSEAVTADSLSPFLALKPKSQLNAQEIQILDPKTFVHTGLVTFDIEKAGKAAWSTQRFTRVYQRQSNGDWLIAHDHLSHPPVIITERPAALPANVETSAEAETPPLSGAAPAQ